MATRPHLEATLVRLRVLLAEDEPFLRELLCDALTEEGFEVVPVNGGAEALEILHRGDALDAVLSDDDMPGLTGRDLVARLRAEGNGIPVVLCSGSLVLTDAERDRLGVGPVLRKPVSSAEVAAALREAVAGRGR